MPELGAQIAEARLAWDYVRCTDAVEAEPHMDRLQDAHRLRVAEPERAFATFLALASEGSHWAMLQAAWCLGFW